jgi:hypothetical protein
MHPVVLEEMARQRIEELRVDASAARRARGARKRLTKDGSGSARAWGPRLPASERS